MFSITTIASSTTKPVEMVNAMRERVSMLKSNRYITAKVPISETGTATVGISVARQLRRNMKTTRITNMRERLSMLKSNRYITAKVPISETGTATVGISVARQLRRNMKTTRITNMTERTRVRSTSLTDARMVVVRSRTTVVLMPWGMDASIDGNSARTRSTVSMIFAPGWRKMETVMEGTPFRYPALRMFDWPAETSATSDSLTAAPLS